ncbi:MAG: hypothetical protein KGH57_04155 [Candidatus Micrarchaeota archaeon]|nr:hypothetical protein [Candidatus Micrarchaeota archaeon]
MRFKPTPELCYLAGLTGHATQAERSQVGVLTQNEQIEERFIKYALKLGVDTKKIMIEEQGTFKHVYFYHSKLAKMIREVLKERTSLPKRRRELAVAFIAGMFDSSGHVRNEKITIGRMDKADELLLELMGVHNVTSKIMNINEFLSLIRSSSILANGIDL